jgi:hypothetical protein
MVGAGEVDGGRLLAYLRQSAGTGRKGDKAKGGGQDEEQGK